MKPLFIFALPRSGSTLLQRQLAAHRKVSTVPEPWFLLPMLSALHKQGVTARYSHETAHVAISEMSDRLPGGEADYLEAVNLAAMQLYGKLCAPGDQYFIDKTPRYHLVVDEIQRAFPQGRFVFLWRNPLAVVASIVNTWGHGKWCAGRFGVDIYQGLENLTAACSASKRRSLAVRYEDLVSDPEETLRRIFTYLELEPADLDNPDQVDITGAVGDKRAQSESHSNKLSSTGEWGKTYCNAFRKSWGRRYLEWIGRERLEIMGYKEEELSRDLGGSSLSLRHLGGDLARAGFRRWFKPRHT